MRRFQIRRPVSKSSATTLGLFGAATGTYTRPRAMAAEPFTTGPTFACQTFLPVEASIA
jgi:hypothetical protein